MNKNKRDKNIQQIVAILKEKTPKNFNEAWNHPDINIRERWRAAIKKEFHDMIRRGVWRTINRRDLPQGRRLVKNKCVGNLLALQSLL